MRRLLGSPHIIFLGNNPDGAARIPDNLPGTYELGFFFRSGVNAEALGRDRALLRLMCESIEEGFAVLAAQGRGGLPRNLSILHTPILRPFAVNYWGRSMRSPAGELCFAAHTRHAPNEVRTLAAWGLRQAVGSKISHGHLDELLTSGSRDQADFTVISQQ